MEFNPAFVLAVEDRLSFIMNEDYVLASKNLWWPRLMMLRPTDGRTETIEFLLSTAQIHPLDGGQMIYDDLVGAAFRLENKDKGGGFKITRNQVRDDRLEKAASWAAQMGVQMAMRPQLDAIALIKAGETNLGYDGVPFFSASHPVHPFSPSLGVYSNLIAANPLVDVDGKPILANYAKAIARLRSFIMPNGQNRNLQPMYLVVGPDLAFAAQLLTQGRFIDATDNIFNSGLGLAFNGVVVPGVQVIVINELAAGEWYVVAGDVGMSVAPLIYSEREPYEMNSYDGVTQAILNIENVVEWQVRGRNDAIYGHPYSMVKSKP